MNQAKNPECQTGRVDIAVEQCVRLLDFALLCVLDVSSKCPVERMQSHIGCICLTFLHCVFSNVSSNCPPERMHSRIGCMCTDVSPQVTYISIFIATLVAALKK